MEIENGYQSNFRRLSWVIAFLFTLAIATVFVTKMKAIEIAVVFLSLTALSAWMVYTVFLHCGRRYRVDENGLTVTWFDNKVSAYSWADFAAVEERTLLPLYSSSFRTHCIICSKIPIPVRSDGYVNADWPEKHIRDVFDIPMSPEMCDRFWSFVPENIPSNRHTCENTRDS